MIDAGPSTLEYGRRTSSRLRRRVSIAFVVLATVVSTAILTKVAWPRAWAWHKERTAAATAASMATKSVAWFVRAAAWREPPTRLKFSTVDSSHVSRPSDTDWPSGMSFGYFDVQGIAFDGPNPRSYMTADAGGLFTHARTDRSGRTELICIDRASVVDGEMVVNVTRYDRFPAGRAVRVLIESATIDLRPLGDARELRIFAGQPDPNDASRFTIPLESHGRPGAIDGVFESAAIVSRNPGVISPAGTVETGVRLTLRPPATTAPANR